MAKDIVLRSATMDDVQIIAEMNQQLNADEGRKTDMNLEDLKRRIYRWLSAGREAVIVERKQDVIGYMLFWRVQDEYYPYKDSIYIRQFFIQPRYRRRGIGQVAFERIVEAYFDDEQALSLDVLESNPEAKAFWAKMGFKVYHTTMRRE